MNEGSKRALVAAAPAGLAVAVFGVLFGALFRPLAGGPLTLLTSALVFSGALQFTIASLLASGAGAASVLAAGIVLNVRHVLLGAVIRPRLSSGRGRRALLSWFLVDEAVGLALAEERDVDRTLFVTGALLYVTWMAGTALGVAGARAAGLEDAAAAVFPVLFVGLAAVTATSREVAVRALGAGALTIAGVLAFPAARGLVPVAAAIAAAALPRGGR